MTSLHGVLSSRITATTGWSRSQADRIAGVVLAGIAALMCWGMFWFAREFQKVCDDLHLASSTVSYLKAIAVASMALSISYAGVWICRPSSSVGKLVGVGLGLAVVVMAVSAAYCYMYVRELATVFDDPMVARAEQADAADSR